SNCPPRFRARARPARERHFSFQFKLHEIVERDASHDFQTFGADLVEGILRGMPWRKIEIDQIDHWNPDLVKRCMIVSDATAKVGKMLAFPQRISSSKDVTSQIDGRIWRQRYLERFIPDHIKQDTAPKILRQLAQLGCKMTAAIETIGG